VPDVPEVPELPASPEPPPADLKIKSESVTPL